MLGRLVVSLVDGHRGVDRLWLDGLLVDDGLNGLMNMAVRNLVSYG